LAPTVQEFIKDCSIRATKVDPQKNGILPFLNATVLVKGKPLIIQSFSILGPGGSVKGFVNDKFLAGFGHMHAQDATTTCGVFPKNKDIWVNRNSTNRIGSGRWTRRYHSISPLDLGVGRRGTRTLRFPLNNCVITTFLQIGIWLVWLL
jgi:hypothetical protein